MDIADHAQRLESHHREASLLAVRSRDSGEVQRCRGDRVYCLDCADAIDAARLKIQPLAVRCTECQTHRERDALRYVS